MPILKEQRFATIRGILFDMDGVLTQSTDADERAWLRWARFHGMEGQFSLAATHGRRTMDTIRALRPDLDAAVEHARMEAFDLEEASEVSLLAGVEPLLASLPAQSWAVVTSASERVMRWRLGAAGLASFPAVTAESVVHGKPDPEPYRRGAELLGLPPGECLVIEDSPAGVRAGKAAGCVVLAVLTSHGAEQLEAADAVVGSLEEVRVAVTRGGELAVSFGGTGRLRGR